MKPITEPTVAPTIIPTLLAAGRIMGHTIITQRHIRLHSVHIAFANGFSVKQKQRMQHANTSLTKNKIPLSIIFKIFFMFDGCLCFRVLRTGDNLQVDEAAL